MELTSTPSVMGANPVSLAGRLHADDDQAIDIVMGKLAKTFKSNDYSYAFEVMYAPIVESMGGKERLLAAVPLLKEQMKQQQIRMISWEPRKPYTYLKGDKRGFAVIPNISEFTMAGQKIKTIGFQLGIKKDGSEWEFVSGEKITAPMLDKFFPDFPKDFELPKPQRQLE